VAKGCVELEQDARCKETASAFLLESMHLDGRSLNSILGQEGGDLGALISLKLDDLSHLLIVDEGAIAGEFLPSFRSQNILS
jgi:hypothetical protein